MLYPRLWGGRRLFWRDIHATAGIWVSVFALGLILTGLPWASAWGSYLSQARVLTQTAPGPVDWTIGGKAPVPKADAMLGQHADHRGMAMTAPPVRPGELARVIATARPLRIAPPVLVSPPDHAGAPWSMSSDAADRPMRAEAQIDGASGQLIGRRGFADRHWAKVALGERGPVWWKDGAPDLNRHLARTGPYTTWYADLEESERCRCSWFRPSRHSGTATCRETDRRMANHRIYATSVASVYPAYVAKAERKGRSKSEVDQIICWLTGHSQESLDAALINKTSFKDFFATAPRINPDRTLITGLVCGVRVVAVEEPTMREIRYLDKLIDELAKGRPMMKILRGTV